MLRDKTRFARRLHGVKKVKNPESQQAILQEMALEISQQPVKSCCAKRRVRPSPIRKTCRLARKTRDFEAVRDHRGDRRRGDRFG